MNTRVLHRIQKLPDPRLQLRLLWPLLATFLVALVVQVVALYFGLRQVASELPADGPLLLERTPWLLLVSALITLAVLVPTFAVVGVLVTFRVAGPLKRFHSHLTTIADGGWPKRCKIRSGDHLQDLCALLNDALEGAHQQGAADGMKAQVRRRDRVAG